MDWSEKARKIEDLGYSSLLMPDHFHDQLGPLVARQGPPTIGLRAFGEIFGYAFAVFALGGVIGPPLMGMGFDATGSYRLVLGGFAVATLIAVTLMTRLGPYRVWAAAAEAA